LPPQALSLPLQEEAAFELRDSAEQGDHQLAGWGAGVDPLATHAEQNKADATAVQVIYHLVCGAPG